MAENLQAESMAPHQLRRRPVNGCAQEGGETRRACGLWESRHACPQMARLWTAGIDCGELWGQTMLRTGRRFMGGGVNPLLTQVNGWLMPCIGLIDARRPPISSYPIFRMVLRLIPTKHRLIEEESRKRIFRYFLEECGDGS
jgi:hypothetical protein